MKLQWIWRNYLKSSFLIREDKSVLLQSIRIRANNLELPYSVQDMMLTFLTFTCSLVPGIKVEVLSSTFCLNLIVVFCERVKVPTWPSIWHWVMKHWTTWPTTRSWLGSLVIKLRTPAKPMSMTKPWSSILWTAAATFWKHKSDQK